jgi:hypothetical protein
MEIVLELETLLGDSIRWACKAAVEMADKNNTPVHFEFNGTHVTAYPGTVPEELEAKWQFDSNVAHDAYLASPEYKKAQQDSDAEEKRKREVHLTAQGTTESELFAEDVPWPYTKEQLIEYVESLVNKQYDYGTCVYAMSMAAEAAFNYVSHRLGVTGFQASCADLDFLRRRTRDWTSEKGDTFITSWMKNYSGVHGI